MKKAATISRAGPAPLSQDFARLLAQGIEYCQQMSADTWTDYNEHDPGLTILEQLCYAITDLGARTGQKIDDLLVSLPGRNISPPRDTLYTGDDILSGGALTAHDYRKLLYDRVPGLKNAWRRAVQSPSGETIRGCYKVLVEIYEGSDVAAIKEGIKQVICANRNVTEDLERIVILTPYPIEIDGVVEIDAQANPVEVLAQTLFNIQNYLSPFPKVQTVEALIHEGRSLDQIFVGPRLNLGVLDDSQLRPYKQIITVQDVIGIILGTSGVKGAHAIRFKEESDTIHLPANTIPCLAPSISMPPQRSYGLRIKREGGAPQSLAMREVHRLIEKRLGEIANHEIYTARSMQNRGYRKVMRGQYLEIATYFSIQHHFPLTYGISRYGIPSHLHWSRSAGSPLNMAQVEQIGRARRKALAQQLKAYLLFCEQLLANYLAQLAQAPQLFSLDDDLQQSYFFQPLVQIPARDQDPPEIIEIFRSPPTTAARSARYVVYVLNERAEILLSSAELPNEAHAIRLKREMIEYGRDARFYRTESVAQMELRLVLHNASHHPIAYGQERFGSVEQATRDAHRLAAFLTRLAAQPETLERRIKHYAHGGFAIRVLDEASRIALDSHPLPSLEMRQRRGQEILECGALARHYQIRPVAERWYRIVLANAQGKPIAYGALRFESTQSAHEGVAALVDWLKRLRASPLLQQQYMQWLPAAPDPDAERLAHYRQGLALAVQRFDPFFDRRNRFLDHLLARFGERFSTDLLRQLDPRPKGEQEDFQRELIRWKTSFLRHQVQLSSARGFGSNYTDWRAVDRPSPTGFEQRLCLLLGLQGHSSGNAYCSAKCALTADDPPFYYWAHAPSPANRVDRLGNQEASGMRDRRQFFVFESTDPALFSNMVTHATQQHNYRIETGALEGTVVMHFTWPGEKQSFEVYRTHSRAAAEHARDGLIRRLRRLSRDAQTLYQGEGLYVLEHILLRPSSDKSRGPKKGTAPLLGDDFYAGRLSILLPNWPARFQNEAFKHFVERVVYENCPAHVAAQCHWLNYPQMAEFERHYLHWAGLKGEVARGNPEREAALEKAAQALRDFVAQLEQSAGGV